jgi:hypothetical protein
MTGREPVETTNLDTYGNAALPWSRPRDLLAELTPAADLPFFLGTVGSDGRPHAAGIGASWFDDSFWIVSGPGTRKSRNLAADPRCTISVRLPGLDLVAEGEATRVTDPETLEALAARYRDGGWPAQVAGDAFTAPYSAPSAGPPPWYLYRFTQASAVGVASEEPHGATRWRFAS